MVVDLLEVNLLYLLDLAEMIFEEPGSEMPIQEFLELLLSLRGDQPIKVRDLIFTNIFQRWCRVHSMDTITGMFHETGTDLRQMEVDALVPVVRRQERMDQNWR